MTYFLKYQQDLTTNSKNSLEKLNQIVFQQSFSITWLKYFQNFYDQSLSYLILVQSQQREKIMKIKKIFTNIKEESQKGQKDMTQKNKSTKNNLQLSFTIDESQHFFKNRIISANFIHDNALIVLENPFQLYFITKKSLKPIKIILQNQYELTNFIASFSFETNDEEKKKQPFILTLYGQDKLTKTNKQLNINLMTFDIKETAQSKDYSPKLRKNNFQMFHDDRLYVFSGEKQNEKDTEIKELLWSFDLQKGYWFALEMKYKELNEIFDQYLCAVYDSGKIILYKNGNFYLLEIYQCKIAKIDIENQQKFNEIREKQKIIGMLVYEKRLYFYTEKSIIGVSFGLQKQKK